MCFFSTFCLLILYCSNSVIINCSMAIADHIFNIFFNLNIFLYFIFLFFSHFILFFDYSFLSYIILFILLFSHFLLFYFIIFLRSVQAIPLLTVLYVLTIIGAILLFFLLDQRKQLHQKLILILILI